MPELMGIGVSALLANQKNLSTTGHNIANANTPGYSRQQTLAITTLAQPTFAGFEGSGVTIEGVRRVVDLFAAAEMRSTGETLHRLDEVVAHSEQLDNILGDESTGLSPILQRFFGSLQTASEDPAAIASRQVVLTSSELVANRLNQLASRLDKQNQSVNTQLDTLTIQVTSLARSVADLNEKIVVDAQTPLGLLPNDLLDERDRVLQEIAELVNVQILETDDRAMNIYTADGQALVVGNRSFELISVPGSEDPSRHEIMYKNGHLQQRVTEQMTGGKIGGLLEFRQDILDESYGQLGVIALGVSEAVNAQHQLGMTLDGQLGGDFFRDINDTDWVRTRAIADENNSAPGSEVITTTIQSVAQMTTSDYRLRFSPADDNTYVVIRESDGVEVAAQTFSGFFPSTVEFDGVEVSLDAGQFAAGDEFLISPSRFAAREIALNVNNVRDLAFAQPVRVEGSEANRGTATVNQGTIIDASADIFSQMNEAQDLNPPLLIQFTSPSTYDVLDNSTPGRPVALIPPLMHQPFVAGVTNTLLPTDLQQQSVVSDGADIGVATRNIAVGTYANGYAAEELVVTSVDPQTSVISRQAITTDSNSSAKAIAAQLSALDNTRATARNQVVIDEINSTTPMTLTINGENFAVTNPAELAIDITQNAILADLGISATSNGSQVVLNSSVGDDFQLEVSGGATDNLEVTGSQGNTLTLAGNDSLPQVTIGGQVDVVFDQGSTMTGASAVFTTLPPHYPTFLGLQIEMGGAPATGDTFEVNFNKDGFADNRNILALSNLQSQKVMSNGESTIRDTYAHLINFVGTKTNEAALSQEAAKTLFERAENDRAAVSGVNLDEEAANVIQYEQAYNASAQLIAVARSIFDALLASVR